MTQSSAINHIPVAQRCSECGKIEVYPAAIHHDASVKHDNCLYTISISSLHVLRCRSCGDVLFDDATDDQISQALREHLVLLSPQEIRAGIRRLGLSPKEFSEQIRIAAETVSRWLRGANIQSRATTNLMRLFFEREGQELPAREATGVVMRDGELSPWQYPIPYTVAPMNTEMPPEMGMILTSDDWALAV